MNRAQKAETVEFLQNVFNESEFIAVCHYKGLSVAKMTELRQNIRAEEGGFKVTKNRLALRALEGTQYEALAEYLKGPTAIAYSKLPVGTAKAAQKFADDNDAFVILGGAMGANMLDADAVKALSKMPSLEELRGTIAGLLKAPAGKLARVAQAPAGQLARVVGAYAAKEA